MPTANSAPRRRLNEQMHEVQLTERVTSLSRASKSPQNREEIVLAALRTLIALASRADPADRQYADLVFEADYFRYPPIGVVCRQCHGKLGLDDNSRCAPVALDQLGPGDAPACGLKKTSRPVSIYIQNTPF